jgi:hypothetical protein
LDLELLESVNRLETVAVNGARGRTRTGKTFRSRDFKSLASTNFATRALQSWGWSYNNPLYTFNAVPRHCCLPQRHPDNTTS